MKKNKSEVSDDSSVRAAVSSSAPVELELEQDRFKLNWLDYSLAPLIAVLAGLWVFPYVGTSINFDDLLYMNLSQYTTPQAWVLNRYGHIYLQKIFFWLAGDALIGTRLYWCFLFFSTSVLVYWCARMLAGRRSYIIGLVAASLFCSQPVFFRYFGSTFADLTVMFLITLGTFVYLAFLGCRDKYRHLFIMILGLIFFWAVKSKETGICMGILFLGLGQNNTGVRSVSQFVRDIGWVCIGMIIGCILLMVFDMIFIGDFWFSVRPSSIRGLLEFTTGEFAHDQRAVSVYTLLSLDPILLFFVLYLFVGWRLVDRNLSRREIVAWLVPLTVMFFLTAVTIRLRCDTPRRYLMPAIPCICVWASQFFRFRLSEADCKSRLKTPGFLSKILIYSAVVSLAFIIVSFLMHRTADFVRSAGWQSPDRFYTCVILPLAITGLLISASVLRKRAFVAVFFTSLCLFFAIYYPVSNNMVLLKKKVAVNKSQWRYEPYRVFADEITFDKNVKILVSADIYKRSWMLGREARAHGWMFNVFFNQEFECGLSSNFEHEIGQFIDGSWEDILRGDYDYGFLTWRDWNGIREKHDTEQLLRKYTLKSDKKTQLILLKKR